MTDLRQVSIRVKESLQKNFRHATLNFIFILAFVNIFQLVFGAENSIVGVIFTIMMSASMARDLTGAPIRHLCIQSGVLLMMTVCACFVSNAPPLAALPVNAVMLFLILYSFTFEYTSHLYFPYILSYLFLVFISPVTFAQLPKRLLGVFAGVVCMIAYQLINGRKRVAQTARDILGAMAVSAQQSAAALLDGKSVRLDAAQIRADLSRLSKIIYDRRKKILCISDTGFAMLDAGRGLENLLRLLDELPGPPPLAALEELSRQLAACQSFIAGTSASLPCPCRASFGPPDCPDSEQLYQCCQYIYEHLLKMTLPETRRHYRKTMLSFTVRLKAALRVSPVRCVYALRVALLLAAGTLLVQLLQLPHGKWLLFTLASVSLPYADDVAAKARKRILATLLGGCAGVVLYSLIPSSAGRTAVMMASGYLSFYFTDYTATFACSTLGALGGAVFLSSFGWSGVGQMLLIRLAYILAGVLIALVVNRLLFPYKRQAATRRLWKKYNATSELLAQICRLRPVDTQLYYNLVIQAHLQEDALVRNAKELNWADAQELLEQCRQRVRHAHRSQPAVL